MAAPPRPDLAAELTRRILDAHYPEDISGARYRVYLWVMHVLFEGGWLDPDTDSFKEGVDILDSVQMREMLQPWLEPDERSAEDVIAYLVGLALSDAPGS